MTKAKNKTGIDRFCPKVRMFKLSDIHPAEYNPRVIDADARQGLAKCLERFGLVELPIVNIHSGKNVIVGGNQRYEIMKAAGVTKCLCIVVDFTPADEKLLNLALNNPALQGRFSEQLDGYIDQLGDEISNEQDLLDLRIEKLRSDISNASDVGEVDDDYVPDIPKKARTKAGDLWQLGDHRLICGDCLCSETIDKLFAGPKLRADLVVTDPPYNMNYQSKSLGGVRNDKMKEPEFVQFILASAHTIQMRLRNGGSYYICMSAAEYPTVFHQLRKLGLKGRQIIWAKRYIGLGGQDYRPQYEVILFGNIGDRRRRTWNGQRSGSDLWMFDSDRGVIAREDGGGMVIEVGQGLDTVQILLSKKIEGKVYSFNGSVSDLWQLSRELGGYVHPTQKPIALAIRAIQNSSNADDIVFDPFCGSGTTLIAAEKLGRKCYAIELDEKYCDVILERWEKRTEQKARKI